MVIDAISEEDLQYLYAEYKTKKSKKRDVNEIDLLEDGGEGDIDPAILI